MRTIEHTFHCIDGAHVVTLDISPMSGVEAVDVYNLDPYFYGHGGYRIEAMINGTPRGTTFSHCGLGASYLGDRDSGEYCAREFLAQARRDGFLPPVKL